jgi:hypothetical protein
MSCTCLIDFTIPMGKSGATSPPRPRSLDNRAGGAWDRPTERRAGAQMYTGVRAEPGEENPANATRTGRGLILCTMRRSTQKADGRKEARGVALSASRSRIHQKAWTMSFSNCAPITSQQTARGTPLARNAPLPGRVAQAPCECSAPVAGAQVASDG